MKTGKEATKIKHKRVKFVEERFSICDKNYYCKECIELAVSKGKEVPALKRTEAYVHNVMHYCHATIDYDPLRNEFNYTNVPKEYQHYLRNSRREKKRINVTIILDTLKDLKVSYSNELVVRDETQQSKQNIILRKETDCTDKNDADEETKEPLITTSNNFSVIEQKNASTCVQRNSQLCRASHSTVGGTQMSEENDESTIDIDDEPTNRVVYSKNQTKKKEKSRGIKVNEEETIEFERKWKEIMGNIHNNVTDVNYLLSEELIIENIAIIILMSSKRGDFFDGQQLGEKLNTLFAVETIIKSKIILQQLLKKKTKIFNEILVDIFSLSNEISRTITRCNDLVLFTMEFDRACSTVKKAFSFNYKKLQSRCEHGSICAEQETIDLINSNNTLFFGIAFDESSFFTNKVYVCTVRIATSTSIIERVLFLDTFTGRSGSDEITEYMEHELDELHLDMSKLVFITSDGDTKLMNDGKVIDSLKDYYRGVNPIFNVWFTAHRLALSFEVLESDPYLGKVFAFVQWMCSFQTRYSYDCYLKNKDNLSNILPKICSLSTTRWLFYGEQINSIYNQYTHIDHFLFSNKNLDIEIKNLLKIKVGDDKQYENYENYQTIFDHKFVIQLTLAKDLLEIANSLSVFMQGHYGLIGEHIHYINSLIEYLKSEEKLISKGKSTLNMFEDAKYNSEKKDMIKVIRRLRESLEKRFLSVGKSIDMRKKYNLRTKKQKGIVLKQLTDNNNIEQLLYIWYIPDNIVNHQTLDMNQLDFIKDEIDKLQMLLNNEEVINIVNEKIKKRSKDTGVIAKIQPDTRVTLMDMIEYICNGEFKQLSRVMYMIMSCFPTSVFPESIFSMISRCLHPNTKITTCLNKVQHRSSFSVYQKTLIPSVSN